MSRKYNEELAALDNSEVFHEFMKVIAYDSGLSDYNENEVSVGHGEKTDSDKIEKLYSDKATEDKDKDGKELIEDAHDEDVEILNSYLQDAGDYKNNVKTHTIMEEVAKKEPRLYNTFHRNISAIHDLMQELVIIAEEMEVRGHDDLVSFADDILQGMDNTNEEVKKNLIITTANTATATASTIGKAWNILKWLGIAVGAGALLYGAASLTGRVDNSKVYSIKIACQSFIKSVARYKEKHRTTLEPEAAAALDSVVRTVSDFETQYYSRAGNFRSLYEQIMILISGPNSSLADVDNAFNKLSSLSAEVDQLSAKMQRPLQDAISNIQAVQQEMENRGDIEGARTGIDSFRENIQSVYSAVVGTDEQLLVDNFNKLLASIDADKARRARKLSNLKSQITTYKQSESVEEARKTNENIGKDTEEVASINQDINKAKKEQDTVKPAPTVISLNPDDANEE